MTDETAIVGEIVPHGVPIGRPSSYTDEMAQDICDRIAMGESLRSICLDDHMPDQKTVYRWLRREDDVGDRFRQQYARAREDQADTYADEQTDIADDGSNDWMEKRSADGQSIGWTLNGEHVQRSKLRIETRRWLAGKLRPKKYGDKAELHHTGAVATVKAPDLPKDQNEAARVYRDFITKVGDE